MFDTISVERFNVDTFLSNTYLVYSVRSLKNNEAIVIDPNFSVTLQERLEALNIKKTLTFLTHEHFDHTTGVNWIKEKFNGELWCQSVCATKMATIRNNRPLSIMGVTDDIKKYYYSEHYVCETERSFDEQDEYIWYGNKIKFVHTPGHTTGSSCIEIGDKVFTGDSLIIDEQVTTRFPSGSLDDYLEKTQVYLMSLDKDMSVYPGHGVSGIKMKELLYEDRRFIRKDGN